MRTWLCFGLTLALFPACEYDPVADEDATVDSHVIQIGDAAPDTAPEDDAAKLIHRADQALLLAKSSGKNRVVVAPPAQ